MPLTGWIERFGRAIFEAPFGSEQISRESPELAEIRLAILREVKSRAHRVSGREVFPYNQIRICMRGIPAEQAGIFTGKFFAQFCEEELRGGLAQAGIRFPPDLRVEVETVAGLPLAGEEWLRVEAGTRPQAASPTVPRRPARLVVLKGAANHAEVALTKARTNIGRTSDVYRTNGPSRRNDLAFDQSSEISRTVSREHAHITLSKKTGEYRLFNDRPGTTSGISDACGLWVIRDGLSYEVHRGARGTKLEPGDEIHLGRAVLKFVQK